MVKKPELLAIFVCINDLRNFAVKKHRREYGAGGCRELPKKMLLKSAYIYVYNYIHVQFYQKRRDIGVQK